MSGEKIAFVVSGKSAITAPGGLGAYAYNSCRIFSELGYKVWLVSFAERDETFEREFGTVMHVRTPFLRLASLGFFLVAPVLARRMHEVMQRQQPDEVVVFGAGIWGGVGNRLRALSSGSNTPVIAMAGYFTTYKHEYWGQVVGTTAADYGRWANLLMRMVYLVARLVYVPMEHRMLCALDAVVVHYQSTRDILLDEVRCLRSDRVLTTPYYVDIYDRESEVKSSAREAGLTRLTVICRQDPRKGLNDLLRAIRLLKDEGSEFQCTIAGSGVFLQRNRDLAQRLAVDDRVAFPGFVESVDELLDQTDVFILPSVEEGSGSIALMEAMKKGVAIVTTLCDGIPEDFVDGETALLVPMQDPVALAAALRRLIDDEALRLRLADNVRTDYPRRFSLAAMCDGIAGVLSEVAARRG